MPVTEVSEVHQYEIVRFVENPVRPENVYEVIENIWKPNDGYEFPWTMEGDNRKKRFVKNWFKHYSWLAYSKLYDGAFCVPCIFFGSPVGHNADKLTVFFKKPLTCWTSATGKLKDHATCCKMHHNAVISMEQFRMVKRGEALAVSTQLC